MNGTGYNRVMLYIRRGTCSPLTLSPVSVHAFIMHVDKYTQRQVQVYAPVSVCVVSWSTYPPETKHALQQKVRRSFWQGAIALAPCTGVNVTRTAADIGDSMVTGGVFRANQRGEKEPSGCACLAGPRPRVSYPSRRPVPQSTIRTQ